MITEQTDKFPEIEWYQGELIERIDHDTIYVAYGESDDGRQWVATWYECDGQFEEIYDIEEQ